jgi:hypothetical protein
MSSAPSSTTSSGGRLSPRLSRMSSSTGSFTSQALQGFRTVSLPGLFPGTHLGILASGLLDKRRDGAVRGGWAKRLFILSTRSLHYYRKVEEAELFGKERGQVLLSDIGYSKVVMPEDAPAGAVEPGQSSYFVAVLSVGRCNHFSAIGRAVFEFSGVVSALLAEAEDAASLPTRRLVRVREQLGQHRQQCGAYCQRRQFRAAVDGGNHANIHFGCLRVWMEYVGRWKLIIRGLICLWWLQF